MITKSAKPDQITRKWLVVDAAGVPVGRLAAEVAKHLRGKYKPYFTPNIDCGDFVVVTNADKIVMKGNKGEENVYWHTLYPGGIRSRTRAQYLEKFPERYVEKVIKGMLPHNKLGAQMFKKLKVYAGPDHPHSAQMPEKIEI